MIEMCLVDKRQTHHIIEWCKGNKSRSTSYSNTWLFLAQGWGRYSKVWYCDSQSNIKVFWIVVERLHISRIFVRLKMFSIVELWSGARKATLSCPFFSRQGTFSTININLYVVYNVLSSIHFKCCCLKRFRR